MCLIYGIDLRQQMRFLKHYTRGSDEWYLKFVDYKTYGKVCPSIKDYLYQQPPTIWHMHIRSNAPFTR